MLHEYNSKYIPSEFWQTALEYHHLRVIKDRTGSGATYGIMQTTTKFKKILCMPTINLVMDKYKKANEKSKPFGDQTVIALCSDDSVSYTMKDVVDADIVLCTPDQLVVIYENNKDIWGSINNELLVLDEEHVGETQVAFRDAFSKIHIIISRFWAGKIMTISATRPFAPTPFLNTFDVMELQNPKIEQPLFMATTNINTFWYFFKKWHDAGDNIILFTNDIRQYRRFKRDICTIIGKSLSTKLKFDGFTNKHILDSQITLVSSAGMEGIDIDKDAHVMILSDFLNDYSTFTAQAIIQGSGRVRGELLSSILYVNQPKHKALVPTYTTKAKLVEALISTVCSNVSDINQTRDAILELPNIIEIDNEMYVDDLSICGTISKAMNINVFHGDNWVTKLNAISKHNHIVFKEVTGLGGELPPIIKMPFKNRVAHYTTFSKEDLALEFEHVRHNLTDGRGHGFSSEMLVAILGALAIQNSDDSGFSNVLLNKVSSKDLIKKLNSLVISVYQPDSTQIVSTFEINVLRNHISNVDTITACTQNLAKNNELSVLGKIRQELKKPEIEKPFVPSTNGFSKQAILMIKKKNNAAVNFLNNRQKETVQVLYYLAYANKYVNDKVDESIAACNVALNSKDAIKNTKTTKGYVKQLAGLVLTNCDNTRQKVKSTRTYSAITGMNIDLIMDIYPYDSVEIDITAANPTFVDGMVGSKLAQTIYANIMQIDGITRAEAKKKYNSTLNKHGYYSMKERRNNFLRWGYTNTQIDLILAVRTKGEMFFRMSDIEQEMVREMLSCITHGNVTRRHDAIVMFGQQEELETAVAYFERNISKSIRYEINRS